MNAALIIPLLSSEPVVFPAAGGTGGCKTKGRLLKRAHSELRWLDVTVRTIGPRSDALELTHWKKVWRPKVEN